MREDNNLLAPRSLIQEVIKRIILFMLQKYYFSLINNEAIHVRPHLNRLNQGWSHLLCIGDKIHTKTRTRWDVNEAVLGYRHMVHNITTQMP